jgi:hypothetical protein
MVHPDGGDRLDNANDEHRMSTSGESEARKTAMSAFLVTLAKFEFRS